MTEKSLRSIFIVGTVLFLGVLVVMSRDSVSQLVSGRTPALTSDVAAGKQVWQGKNCNDCHTILGIGGYYAPDLTKVMERRDPVWLANWLADPQAVNPATTMPNQRLAAADVTALVSFFQWVGGINTNDWPPQPRLSLGGGADTASGAVVFQQKGCSACHRIAGKGPVGPGPDLTRIGGTPYDALPNTPEFLAKWLENPQAQKPGTVMPRIPLIPTERDALVRYLTSLK